MNHVCVIAYEFFCGLIIICKHADAGDYGNRMHLLLFVHMFVALQFVDGVFVSHSCYRQRC